MPQLNSNDDRRDIIRRVYGIERVIFARFDQAMMTMGWEDYIQMLVRDYGAVHFVAGHDHRFGHRNEGTVERLREKCRELGLGCDIIPEVEIEGITVSSTYIRTLVEQGDMERAALFLGHPHCLSQTVQHGKRLGRTIGIPTVNLAVPAHVLTPARGVYITRAFLPDGRSCPGVTNVGTRPTVTDGDTVSVETYLLGFDGDLYGQTASYFLFLDLAVGSGGQVGVDEAVDVAVHHRLDVAHLVAGAGVLGQGVGHEHVGADLAAPLDLHLNAL